MLLEIGRVVAVIALLGVAAALATPKGRIPLALRGVYRILRKDAGVSASDAVVVIPLWKRWLAFALVLAAIAMAICL